MVIKGLIKDKTEIELQWKLNVESIIIKLLVDVSATNVVKEFESVAIHVDELIYSKPENLPKSHWLCKTWSNHKIQAYPDQWVCIA